MKKIESVFNGSLGWRKTRSLTTFPHMFFGLISLILLKKFTIKVGGEAQASS